MKKNVLLIGSGGREHALSAALASSKEIGSLYIAPGNPGTAIHGQNVDLNTTSDDFDAIYEFVSSNSVHLVVVGPEQPLVDGLADFLTSRNIPVFGPDAYAAALEGSKEFAKRFMASKQIPTAGYNAFAGNNTKAIKKYILSQNQWPVVLKADGLAAGKGVVICPSITEVEQALNEMQEGGLKNASARIVVEEFMHGEEASVFVLSDGKEYVILGNAQDHKRIGDGDTGANTGGMGAYSPAPLINPEILRQIEETIIRPTIRGMQELGHPYRGVLYIGLMITENSAKVVEYNCRFGDPECQVLMPALQSDALELFYRCATGSLIKENVLLASGYFCGVVLASQGYPASYEKGFPITGLDTVKDAVVYHAGTAVKNGVTVTNGGRVLCVVANADTLEMAIKKAYAECENISFSNKYLRKDIGQKGLKYLS